MTDWMRGQPPQDPPAGDEPARRWSITVTGEHLDAEIVAADPEDQIDLWDEAGQALLGPGDVTLEGLVEAYVKGLDKRGVDLLVDTLQRGLNQAEELLRGPGDPNYPAACGALEGTIKGALTTIKRRRSS